MPIRPSDFGCVFFFFFNDTATTEIYTLSLHDALPIWRCVWQEDRPFTVVAVATEGGDPFRNGDYWTTSYRLEFSFDAYHFEPYKEDGKIKVCLLELFLMHRHIALMFILISKL